MANSLAKDLEIMFEESVEGFDAACVISRECDTAFPDPQTMQRAGDTYYVSQDYQASVVSGLDVSAAAKTDIVERKIPTTFRQPDNVVYELDAKEMRDSQHKIKMGKAAALALAGEVDQSIYNAVALQGSIVVKKVGVLTWDDGSLAEALLVSRGVKNVSDRKLFMNAFDYRDIAKDLGNKAYMTDWSKSAYERSMVPNIATFKTFRTDNQVTLPAIGTVTGTTVNGAQSFTPSSMTGDVPTDNRRMTLSVAGANLANIKNGDAFTIAGVNAVHNITKSDTGQAMTFRVVSGGGTASLVITPAIVAAGPYKNVTAAAAAGAAVTFLNTAAKPVNPFWVQGAVCLDYGRLAFPSGEGANVMTATTKQGVPLIMSYNFNHLTAKTSVRFTTLHAATVRSPELAGVILANQT